MGWHQLLEPQTLIPYRSRSGRTKKTGAFHASSGHALCPRSASGGSKVTVLVYSCYNTSVIYGVVLPFYGTQTRRLCTAGQSHTCHESRLQIHGSGTCGLLRPFRTLFFPPFSPFSFFPLHRLSSPFHRSRSPLHLRLSRRLPRSFTSVIITHFTLRSPLDARTCRRSDEERTSLPTRLSIESLISPSPLRASFRLPSLSHHCALRRDSSACDAFLASRILAFLWVAFRVAKIDLFT